MKLPADFEKNYFDLLTPVESEGTLKNRRNLLVTSFSITVLYVIGKSLSAIKLLGIELKGADSKVLLVCAMLLVLFWALMFCIHAIKDFQINKERKYLLVKHTDLLKERLDTHKSRYSNLDASHLHFKQIGEFEREYDIFLSQQKRTKKARIFTMTSYVIEYSLPLFFSIWCFGLLVSDFYSVFTNT